MKKIILTTLVILGTFSIAHSADSNYSAKYITNFKTCTPYTETYNVDIPTNDPNTPILHLQSKESIIGKQNDKCKTQSTVSNLELKQKLVEVNCQFTPSQLASITSKMEKASTDPNVKKALQDELNRYVQTPTTCTTQKFIEQQN